MRADQPDGQLRGCPLCGTKVADAKIGLRDFAWLNNALPGKIGGMDIDLVLTNNKAGLAMAFELKPYGVGVSLGARMTLKFLVQHGVRCFLVQDGGDVHPGQVIVGEMLHDGDVVYPFDLPMDTGEFAQWVCRQMEFC
jgi:hypothetical protein